jgi:hypothetical protein
MTGAVLKSGMLPSGCLTRLAAAGSRVDGLDELGRVASGPFETLRVRGKGIVREDTS